MRSLIKSDLLFPRISGYVVLGSLLLIGHFLLLSPYSMFILFSLSILIALLIYDSFYKMNRFFNSMPIQPNKIILSRYFSSLIFIVSLVVMQILFTILYTFHPYANTAILYIYSLKDIVIILCLGIIFISTIIPLIYLFKSIYISLTLIGIVFFTGVIFTTDLLVSHLNLTDNIDLNRLEHGYQIVVEHYVPGQPYVTLFFASIMLLFCSYFISVKLFARKDLV